MDAIHYEKHFPGTVERALNYKGTMQNWRRDLDNGVALGMPARNVGTSPPNR